MKIKLLDGCFKHISNPTCQIGFDPPQYIEWERFGPYRDIRVVTDHYLPSAHSDHNDSRVQIAWLLEPAVINRKGYDAVRQHYEYYDYIISHDIPFLSFFPKEKRVFAPASGSSLYGREWMVYPKSKHVLLISSDKKTAPGHKFRHEIVGRMGNQMDIIGRGYKPFAPEEKAETLAPYMFQIVVHNTNVGDYWSDILTDCIATGTVPIVWGGHYLHKYFDMRGIICFNTLDELLLILRNLTEKDYYSRMESVKHNLEIAFKEYKVIEDYLYNHFFKNF